VAGLMDMPPQQLQELIEFLQLFAARRINRLWWRGVKLQPEDLVDRAFELVLDGTRPWDQERNPDPKLFFCGIIKSLVSHAVESAENTQGLLVEPGAKTGGLLDIPSDRMNPGELVANTELSRDFQTAVKHALADDPLAYQLLECLQADIVKPAEMAEVLNTSVREINNAQKRLARKLEPVYTEFYKRSRS
jgi:DNA-directed RNA polymerase specialized sigma24 family protein